VKRGDAAAIAFLALLVTAMFGDVLFAGRNFYFRDLTRFYYPMKKVVREIVLAGEFPSWNPYNAAGQPLAANPEYEIFYPPQWLILLPEYDLGYRLHIVVHFYIAAFGMYALLRRRQLSIRGALFGAIAFTFGGLLLSSINLLPILFCAVWLPWALLAVEARRFGALAVAMAMPMLAGEPVTIAQMCLIVIAFAAYRRWLVRAAGALVVAGLLSAVQLLPALDHFRDSVRARGFSFAVVSTWSTPPEKLAELLIPGLMGPLAQHARIYWGTAKYGWLDPFYLSVYFGLIAIAFAIAGGILRLPGWWAAWGAMVFSVVLALGKHTPLLRILYESGAFASFRYPEKFLLIGIFALTAFSALVFDRADGRVLSVALIVALAVGLASLALLIVARQPWYGEAFLRFWGVRIHPLASVMVHRSESVWVLGLVRAVIVAAVLLLMKRSPRWSSAAVIWLVVDLAHERIRTAETVDGEFFRAPPAIASHIRPGDRLFHQADWYGAAPIARQYFDLPEMYQVIRDGVFPFTGSAWGIPYALNRDIDQTFLKHTADLNAAMAAARNRGEPNWWKPFMAMSAATHRAMYLPFDPKRLQPIILVPEGENRRFRAEGGTVTVLEERSNSVLVEVQSQEKTRLVCSVTRHKYWHAAVDGRSVDVDPVNIAFQAVDVPAGRHRVALEYRNPLIVAGGAISLAALLGLIFFMIRS
jgi:hypothetical protein